MVGPEGGMLVRGLDLHRSLDADQKQVALMVELRCRQLLGHVKSKVNEQGSEHGL